MKISLLSFFLFLFLAFSWKAFSWFEWRSLDERETNPFKIEANKELFEKFQKILPSDAKIEMYPELRSGHRPTRDLTFDFTLSNVVSNNPEEVKIIFLSYFAKIVEILNTTPQIRPYMNRFPLGLSDVNVWMMLSDRGNVNQTKDGKPRIYRASFYDGKVSIKRWAHPEGSSAWVSEECLLIPSQELTDILLPQSRMNKKLNREIAIPSYPKYEGIVTEGLKERFQFYIRWAQKEEYIYLADEGYLRPGFTNRDDRIKQCLGSSYCAQEKRLSLDEAKELVRKASQAHLSFYQKEETANRQVTNIQKDNNESIDGKARQENLSLRFLFWDKYIDYVQPPYIAEIYTFGRKAYYFTADDRQRLVLLAEEELPNEWDEPKDDGMKKN